MKKEFYLKNCGCGEIFRHCGAEKSQRNLDYRTNLGDSILDAFVFNSVS